MKRVNVTICLALLTLISWQHSASGLSSWITQVSPQWKHNARIAHIQLYPELFANPQSDKLIYDHLLLMKHYGYNAVGICAYHYRFDRIDEWPKIEAQIRKVCQIAQPMGIKVIEHHSAVAARPVNFENKIGIGDHTIGELITTNCKTGKTDVAGDPKEGTVFLCPNNPLLLQAYLRHVKGILDSGVDAIMSDDMTFYRDVYSCTCQHCRKAFVEYGGIDLPEPGDKGFWNNYDNPEFRKWCRFRSDSVANFLGKISAYIRQNSSGKTVELLTCNAVPVDVAFNVARAINLEKLTTRGSLTVNYLEPYDCATYYDYFPNWRHHAIDTIITRNAGKRTDVPVWIGWYVSGTSRGLNYSIDPQSDQNNLDTCKVKVQTTGIPIDEPNQILLDQMIFMYGMGQCFGGKMWNCWAYHHAKDVLKFDSLYPGLSSRKGSTADVGLVFSAQTRDNFQTGSDGYTSAFKGWATTLIDENIQFDVVDDQDLAAGLLNAYKVLILGDTACLSKTQCEKIRQYVNSGGTLIATHMVSACDPNGNKLGQFGLADVLGIEANSVCASAGNFKSDPGKFSALGAASIGKLLNRITPKGSYVDVKIADKPDAVCWISPNSKDKSPAVIIRKAGKGKVLYCSLNAEVLGFIRPHRQVELGNEPKWDGSYKGKCVWNGCEDENYRQLLVEFVNWAKPDCGVSMTESVKGLIWQTHKAANDSVVIHSLNMSGCNYKKGQEYRFPLTTNFPKLKTESVTFKVDTEKLGVSQATLFRVGFEPVQLKIELGKKTSKIRIPAEYLKTYAAIVLEK